MRATLTIFFIFLATILFGQNRHLSLGLKGNGICFGNSSKYNGIRLNIWDKNVNGINGLNVSGLSEVGRSNGLSIGILELLDSISNGIKIGGIVLGTKTNGISLGGIVSNDTISNGLKIGILGAWSKRHNGIAMSVLSLNGEKFNGFGLAGFNVKTDTLNGLFIGTGVTSDFGDSLKVINGIAISIFGIISSKLNGLAVSVGLNFIDKQKGVAFALVNSTSELHGFQFGLINHAGNNRPLFRWMPLINFNLRANTSR